MTTATHQVTYRRLLPRDFEALVQRHREIFPLEYEQSFYNNAIFGDDNRFCFAAVVPSSVYAVSVSTASPTSLLPSHQQGIVGGAGTCPDSLSRAGATVASNRNDHGDGHAVAIDACHVESPSEVNVSEGQRAPCSTDGELLGLTTEKNDGYCYEVGNGEALVGFITARVYSEQDEQWQSVLQETLLPTPPALKYRWDWWSANLSNTFLRYLDATQWCHPGNAVKTDNHKSKRTEQGDGYLARHRNEHDYNLPSSCTCSSEGSNALFQSDAKAQQPEPKRDNVAGGLSRTEGIRSPVPPRTWCAMYISTLGVARPFRKLGVARELVRRVYEAADEQPNCLALYLHVLKSNRHAIHFYESLRFSCVNTLQQFYWINQQHHDACCYLRETSTSRNLEQHRFRTWCYISNPRNWLSRLQRKLGSILRVSTFLGAARHKKRADDTQGVAPIGFNVV